MSLNDFSYRKLTYIFALWFGGWTVLQAIALQLTFGFGWSKVATDAIVTNAAIAMAGYNMIVVMKHYNPGRLVIVAMSIGLTAISVLATQYIVTLLVNETPEYLAFLEKSMIIRGLYSWLMILSVGSFTRLWLGLVEHQLSEQRKVTAERLSREAELSQLRQQLQPHFLFNSLNSVSALAGSRPEEARKMIQQLSDFFRATLRKDDQQLIPLSEELEHLSLYLEIEKVRFGHRLRTDIQCEGAAMSLRLPPLLLQPVVENAIKFGLYDTLGETTIVVKSMKEDNILRIVVENPFDPSGTPPLRGTGFGLSSIRRRLYLLYARNDLMKTSQQENIFITTIRIPQNS